MNNHYTPKETNRIAAARESFSGKNSMTGARNRKNNSTPRRSRQKNSNANLSAIKPGLTDAQGHRKPEIGIQKPEFRFLS